MAGKKIVQILHLFVIMFFDGIRLKTTNNFGSALNWSKYIYNVTKDII